jgi:hypothetical protein
MLLVNETPDYGVDYDIWVTNDKVMNPLHYLGRGNINPHSPDDAIICSVDAAIQLT